MTRLAERLAQVRRDPDEGAVMAWTLVMVVVLWMAVGLVVDGGRAIAAHVDAVGVADQAARSAVDQLDQTAYRTGQTNPVAPGAAEAAACAWVARERPDARCTATRSGDGVTVHVRIAYTPVVLIGLASIPAGGTATARPAIGDITEVTP